MAEYTRRSVGQSIKAGTLLLFTAGEYSSFGVCGIYRALTDFVVPGRKNSYSREIVPDINKISANPEWVEELEYTELWGGE